MTLPPALILAGGKSSRMGREKALLKLGNETMLGHIIRKLAPQVSSIALNAPAGFADPEGLRLVPDTLPGQLGPLAGILSGLRDISEDSEDMSHLLVVPSDSPFFPVDLVLRLEALLDHPETIAVASSGGRTHPVFGLWPLTIAGDLEDWLEADPQNRRLQDFLARHRVATVDFTVIETRHGPLDPFFNVNTPEDLAEAHVFLEALS